MVTMAGETIIIFLSDCDSDYRCDERSWKSDSNEGKDASFDRKKPYSSGHLYLKNWGSTRKQIATMDVAMLWVLWWKPC